MVSQEVMTYVQRLRSMGYAPQAIRQNLLQAGYSVQEADAALAVSPVAARAARHDWRPLLFGGIAGVAVIVVLIILLLPSGIKVTLTTQPQQLEVRAGGAITFSDALSLDGDAETITLIHELVAPETGNIIDTVEETIPATSDSVRTTSRVTIPSDVAPGRYLVRTTARADGAEAEASFSFKIVPAPVVSSLEPPSSTPLIPTTPEAPAQTECNDFDPCTEDTIKDGECVFESMQVCCGDYVCDVNAGETSGSCARDCAAPAEAKSTQTILDEAQDIAVSDVERAKLMCGTLAQRSDADTCYDTVARTSGQSSACLEIGTGKTRDSCLLYFAIQKDEFSVCAKIDDPTAQSSCYSFKNLNELSQATQA
ncbi:hypothetical protein HY493_03535 [Candidatus Woesearchaeota archaeon]|nr:hypothetical protein [Candidatus Woesearchaeota archaeon]